MQLFLVQGEAECFYFYNMTTELKMLLGLSSLYHVMFHGSIHECIMHTSTATIGDIFYISNNAMHQIYRAKLIKQMHAYQEGRLPS